MLFIYSPLMYYFPFYIYFYINCINAALQLPALSVAWPVASRRCHLPNLAGNKLHLHPWCRGSPRPISAKHVAGENISKIKVYICSICLIYR